MSNHNIGSALWIIENQARFRKVNINWYIRLSIVFEKSLKVVILLRLEYKNSRFFLPSKPT